jgi:PAS domain S-box-containing protein
VIKVLFVEDSPDDMLLLQRSLKRAGLEIDSYRVDNLEDLQTALSKNWDIILSDFHLPGFTSTEVLELLKKNRVRTPLIIVSGAVSDEVAADLMRSGASDFVRKENMPRLAPAILREIEIFQDKEKNRSALRESENLFRSLANSIPQLAWMADRQGKLTWFNQRWLDYTRMTYQQLEGDGWLQVFPEPYASDIRKHWLRTIETGESISMENPIRSGSGETRWFLTKVSPVKDENGQVLRWLGTNTDVDLERNIRENLRTAKEAAEAANSLKSTFLANMSHEIRTPMTAVLGFTEILRNPEVSIEVREDALTRIDRAGRSLLRLIDDVLDISKIEAGKFDIKKIAFSPLEVVMDVISLLKLQAEQKGIQLTSGFSDQVPQIATTDPIRLRQILMNLIGNAVKFTNQGEVKVQVGVDKLNELNFHVLDSGIGISKKDQDKLFHPFAQADESITRKFGGTGLGLILSKRLAEHLGGKLTIVRSEVGFGSHFVLRIPAGPFAQGTVDSNEFAQTKPTAAPKVSTHKVLSGFKILVVDDVLDNQVLMRIYLEGAGAHVDFASNGEEAISKAISRNYNLILMDVQMPVLDGIQATMRLRNMNYVKPIFALTAHAMPEEIQRSMDAGCNEHLTKPISKDILVGSISKYIQQIH